MTSFDAATYLHCLFNCAISGSIVTSFDAATYLHCLFNCAISGSIVTSFDAARYLHCPSNCAISGSIVTSFDAARYLHCPFNCAISGSIVTSFDAASSSDTTLDSMLGAIAAEVKDEKPITFDGETFMYEKNSMLVQKKPYGTVEKAVSEIFLCLSTIKNSHSIIISINDENDF